MRDYCSLKKKKMPSFTTLTPFSFFLLLSRLGLTEAFYPVGIVPEPAPEKHDPSTKHHAHAEGRSLHGPPASERPAQKEETALQDERSAETGNREELRRLMRAD
jgi:hypothetical protein